MLKTTLSAIKAHAGKDITRATFNECKTLYPYLEKLAYSIGTYGINGALFIDKRTGEYYKITTRSSALFQLI